LLVCQSVCVDLGDDDDDDDEQEGILARLVGGMLLFVVGLVRRKRCLDTLVTTLLLLFCHTATLWGLGEHLDMTVIRVRRSFLCCVVSVFRLWFLDSGCVFVVVRTEWIVKKTATLFVVAVRHDDVVSLERVGQ
jgi:hypothetical protein